jgi:hypothetical protein
MNNTKTITIDGKEYEINIEKAIELGAAKKKRAKITDIISGDLFIHPKGLISNLIVVRVDYDRGLYILMASEFGYCFNVFSNNGINKPIYKTELIQYLNDKEMEFHSNIGDNFSAMVQNITNNKL